jgi:hypothetical protein
VIEARAAQAAVGFGDLDVHEPGLEGALQDLARELVVLVVVGGDRRDLLLGEVARGRDEGLLLFGEGQVVRHGRMLASAP